MRVTVLIRRRGRGYIASVTGVDGGPQGARAGLTPDAAAATAAELMHTYAVRQRDGGDLMAPPEVLALVPIGLRSVRAITDPHVMRHGVRVPDDLEFADLHLARHTDGSIMFEWGPIERICEASDLDVALFRHAPEDNVGGLIAAWYVEHRHAGGEPDPVAEDLIAEIRAEH